jgi:hypothetical protein
MRIKPGIAAYVDDLAGLEATLTPLLAFAELHVPAAKHARLVYNVAPPHTHTHTHMYTHARALSLFISHPLLIRTFLLARPCSHTLNATYAGLQCQPPQPLSIANAAPYPYPSLSIPTPPYPSQSWCHCDTYAGLRCFCTAQQGCESSRTYCKRRSTGASAEAVEW